MKVIELPINTGLGMAWAAPSISDLVKGFGEQPDAIFDFESMLFSATETRIIVVAYRNHDAWVQKIPLPGFPKLELRLTREEHIALAQQNPGFADLETSVREAAWSLMRTHPKMLRGTMPADGQQDTRQNAFATGELVELS
jgi:hypothetical protein